MTGFAAHVSPYQAFHSVLDDCTCRLAQALTLVQKGNCDRHGVHQARVALRRLRAARKAFSPMADESGWKPLDRAAKKIAARLGQVRDLDVLGDTLMPQLEKEAARHFAAACDNARKRRCRTLLRDLATPPYAGFLPSLSAALRLPLPDQPPPTTLHAFADRSLQQRRRRVLKLARKKATLAQQHALRKRIKELRYASEFFSALYPPRKVSAYLGRLQAAQDALGTLIDCSTGVQQLVRLAHESPELEGWLPSLLKHLGRVRAAAKTRLAPALKALGEAPPFWKA